MISPIKPQHQSNSKSPRLSTYIFLLQRMRSSSLPLTSALQIFNSHAQPQISYKDFQLILGQLNVSASASEFSSFCLRFGKNNVFQVATIKRLIASRGSSAKSSLTMSPYRRGSSMTIGKSILERTIDTPSARPSELLADFWKTIREKLGSPEVITDFFYVGREFDIGIEEFKESCESILTEEFDFFSVFNEISEKNTRVAKADFTRKVVSHLQALDSGQSIRGLQSLRMKLKKNYKSFQSAVNEFTSSGLISISVILHRLGLKSLSKFLPETMTKYQFKQFYFNNEEVCCVDSCAESSQEYEYCNQHFKGALLRGEEAIGKISASTDPENCVSLLTNLLLALKHNLPLTFPGIHRRDVLALQLYLKYKQDKKAMSLTQSPYER